MFGISLARISLLTGSSLGGGVGVSATLDLNFRGQGYSAAMAGYTFNQLIDFTRTSSATYVDATGKIVPTAASRNLLTFTQEFDNGAWVKNNATITANAATAPDGTLTADTWTAAAASIVYLSQTVPVATHVFSVYAKAGTHGFIQLTNTGDAQAFANFNLTTGVVGTAGTKTTATITAVGDGWYRCTAAFNGTTTFASGHRFYMVGSASAFHQQAYTAAGTETVFLWGAQLEAGSTLTDYTRNVGSVYPPRFDYDPVTLAPRGLLVEEQRTNLLLRSEEFDNASWVKSSVTVTTNAVLSPDGTVDADLIVADTNSSSHVVTQSGSVSGTFVLSVYAKAAGYNNLRINTAIAGAVPGVVSLVDGSVLQSGSYTITTTSVGNGWYRVQASATGTIGASFIASFGPSNNTTGAGFTGDGTSGIYLWGAQLEVGSFATSYIPTVASQVTRTADVATITGANFSQWYNQSEGTFVVEIGSFSSTSTRSATFIAATDNPVADDWILMSGTASGVNAAYRNAGVNQADLSPAGAIPSGGKMAFAYAAKDFAACVSGGTVSTDTSGTLSSDVTVLRIGAFGTNPTQLNGHIRSLRYYPTSLKSQLPTLTA